MSDLSAVMASDDDFFGEPWVLLGRGGDFETGMCILALGTLGTEASQVVDAEHPAHMSVPAVWTMPAEACKISSHSVIGSGIILPLSYQGQSLTLASGSMCRKGHSLLWQASDVWIIVRGSLQK